VSKAPPKKSRKAATFSKELTSATFAKKTTSPKKFKGNGDELNAKRDRKKKAASLAVSVTLILNPSAMSYNSSR
jgi:hypothetical protein